MTESFDIAVIGGGPAGAHAALKAALLFRTCVLFDKGRRHSRIYWSPRIANLPGRYGESGRSLVDRGYAAIGEYEKDIGQEFATIHEDTEVTGITRTEDGFLIIGKNKQGEVTARAKHIVLASGCVDRQPQLRDFRRRDIEAVLPYANKGLADYCLLCDGHTVKDKRVAVLGCSPGVRGIARSLKKNFGAETVLVPLCNTDQHMPGVQDPHADWREIEEKMEAQGIPILYGEVASFSGIKDGRFAIEFADGRQEWFDKAWISMGWYKVNNEQAVALGGATDADGFVLADGDGRMLDEKGEPVEGVYVIGDLRSDTWKQIPIAWGEAETAVVHAFVYS